MTPAAKRAPFWTPPAAVLALALAWLFRPDAVPVDLATVERGPLTVSVSDEVVADSTVVARARLLSPAAARRRGDDSDCVTVYSPVSGAVLRVVTESEGVVQAGAPLLEAGQRVIIEACGGEQPLAGRVRRVEPRERWLRLVHGYRVEPRIILWEADDVLREVEIGQGNGLEAEVRGGLAAGERIVLHPGDRVSEGARLVERGP
jgi:HlyD family secretion protein